ncbi:uncharacterized protein V3H82_025466 isoform 1-T1 [Fundulus diaphanus]
MALASAVASRFPIHSQLSSIMEAMAKSAFSQVCKLVDEDSAELRSEVSRLLSANSALAEKVNSLQDELTSARGHPPEKGRRYCSVGVQTVRCSDEERRDVTHSPTIDGIFGKDWCINLWKDRDPFSPRRSTDSTGSPDKPSATRPDHDFAELKEEGSMPNAATNYGEETTCNEKHEESTAEESDQSFVDYSVDGSTCSLPLDQDAQQEMPPAGTEETTAQLMSINDTTEESFRTHVIPIKLEDDEEEDDNAQFVQASQNEAASSPAVWPGHDEQQTLPANGNKNRSPLVKYFPKNMNMVSAETTRAPKSDTFTCQICSRTFFHKGTLTHHMKSHKANYCSICKQHFPQRKKLKSHSCVLPVYLQRMSKSCEFCGKSFANHSSLRIHYVVHTGEKPYRCSLCGKRFTQKGNLKCHLRIHTGERPFLCGKCGRTFTQKINLTHHLMAHLNREVVGGGSRSGTQLA